MPLVSRTFNQIIDFTRTSSATYVDATGKIVPTAASRNLLTFTQEFDNAGWSKGNATITANAVAAPDGTLTAEKLVDSTANSEHYVTRSMTLSAGIYTFSAYLKQAELSSANLFFNATVQGIAYFNLANGTVSVTANNTVDTATITNVGNGWYRCTITTKNLTAGTYFPVIGTGNPASYTGNGTSGIYVWGAQLELGSTATDYTRNVGGVFPPRFDYDPVTLAPKGLLIEEQRTNLLTYSEQFDNAIWLKSNATVTANATTSPDGTTSADKLVEAATASAHTVLQIVTVSSGASYTFSVYAKAAERSQIQIQYFDGTTNKYPVFSLVDGTKVTDNGIGTSWTSTSMGNGWWRFTITVTSAGTTAQLQLYPAIGGTNSYTGDGTSGIYLWGAQLEAGAFATSYIPTVASQVTRTVDVATITGANFAPWYNQNEGTFVSEFSILGFASNQRSFSANDGTVSNEIGNYSSTGSVRMIVTTAGTTVATPIGLAPIVAGTVYKAAFAAKTDDFGVSVNGGAVVADTSGAMPVNNRLTIGADYAGLNNLNGHIRSIRYYPTRLSNAQLQALTA